MAQKRMFSLAVIDTDAFMDMPVGAQALYFHLGMHGDDDGFVASPKTLTRAVGCSREDFETLVERGFIIPFESGVVAIRDWRLNNALKKDRCHETVYQEEKARLALDSAGRCILVAGVEPNRDRPVSGMETEHNVEEHNVEEHNVEEYSVEEHNREEQSIEEQNKGERGGTPRRAARFTPPSLVWDVFSQKNEAAASCRSPVVSSRNDRLIRNPPRSPSAGGNRAPPACP